MVASDDSDDALPKRARIAPNKGNTTCINTNTGNNSTTNNQNNNSNNNNNANNGTNSGRTANSQDNQLTMMGMITADFATD